MQRSMTIVLAPLLALLVMATVSAEPKAETKATEGGPALQLVNELWQRFDALTGDPVAYQKLVQAQCSQFPEGDLFPYLFPAYAYTNLAMQQPRRREEMLGKVRSMLDLAIPVVAQRVRAPGGQLTSLQDYRQHGTYICQLNVGLGAARLLGDRDHEALHKHLTQLIRKAMDQDNGKPLFSFPGLIWPFDTIPCLFSLALYELGTKNSADAAPLTIKHLHWVLLKSLDKSTGLPCSQLNKKSMGCTVAPRGCDLSFRLMMLFQFEPQAAKNLYEVYVRYFWKERFLAAGFAEWPDGATNQEDVDSGPIIMGVGTAASALGIGAAKAARDEPRFKRLVRQTIAARDIVHRMLKQGSPGAEALLGGLISLSPDYTSGFLYGDAVLFWGLTWTKWRKL